MKMNRPHILLWTGSKMPSRYNLRKRNKEGVQWIEDDTLNETDTSDSEWEESSEEEDEDEEMEIKIPKGSSIQIILTGAAPAMEEEEHPFLQHLLDKYGKPGSRRQSPALRGNSKDELIPYLELNDEEEEY